MNPTLSNWYIQQSGDPFTAPELRYPQLCGTVSNHQHHEDGKQIVTSQVLGKTSNGLVKTKNTNYILGPCNPKYEEQFPDCSKRFLKSLTLVD